MTCCVKLAKCFRLYSILIEALLLRESLCVAEHYTSTLVVNVTNKMMSVRLVTDSTGFLLKHYRVRAASFSSFSSSSPTLYIYILLLLLLILRHHIQPAVQTFPFNCSFSLRSFVRIINESDKKKKKKKEVAN